MMLSIIVPIYNVKLYLEECIDSLVSQDYRDCEIIMVDDGSTDGSGEICDQLLKKDSRLKVIHQSNEGLSSARNTGLLYATGKYISFIDSDDLVSSNMFTSLIDAIEKNNADVAICNFEVFNRLHRYNGTRYFDEVIEYSYENQVKFYGASLDSSCNRVYKAEPIRRLGLQFEHKSKVAQEDYWFLLRLFTHITRIVTVSECHYKYRERGSSITKSHSDGDITKRCIDFLLLAQRYIANNSKRNSLAFLNFAFMNMFMASVNNASNTSPSTIKAIINSYFSEPQFIKAISTKGVSKAIPENHIRHAYDMICFTLLRNKFLNIYSILESIRLKRLRSHNRTNLYFD